MVMVRKQQMACLSILVLVVLPLESPFLLFADGSTKFTKLGSGPSSNQLHRDVQSHHGFFKASAEQNAAAAAGAGDGETWVDDKRKIRTGPNPLHNR